MSKKIVISKSGYDATSETNPNNLVFSSDYNTLKYYASGYVDIDYDQDTGGSTTYYTSTAAHGLSYIPFFYCFIDTQSDGTFLPCPYFREGLTTADNYYAWSDATNIKFVVEQKSTTGSTYTARFRYFIFKNEIDT